MCLKWVKPEKSADNYDEEKLRGKLTFLAKRCILMELI